MKQNIYHMVAVDEKNGIGKDGKLPWHLPKDLKFFQLTTLATSDPEKRNMVVMGRATWESIPENHRPLKGRLNIVLTRNPDYKAAKAIICNSLEEAYELADETVETIFLIGGASLFESTMNYENLAGLFITKIDHVYDCDTFYPEIPKSFSKITELGKDSDDGIKFDFLLYERQ